MPRPRWDKLAPEKQTLIRMATLKELGEHGVDGASYNRIIAMVGSTGMSESALKSELVDKYSFNQGDVDLLVASPTFRQLMGWI